MTESGTIRSLSILFLVLFRGIILSGQERVDPADGSVSYISKQNVYVRFLSTEKIKTGDTLFILQGEKSVAALIVTALSSISCVCTPLPGISLKVSDKVLTRKPPATEGREQPQAETVVPAAVPPPVSPPDTAVAAQKLPGKKAPLVSGYFVVASYANFANTPSGNSLRMRYTASVNARNIGHTGLSFESYLSFNHSDDNWDEIQSSVFNGLKIYNLSINYAFNEKFRLWLGRRINPNISNMGAVDGLQFEMKFKPITLGIIGGYRPDYEDYGFNFSLIQFGAFIAHEQPVKNGYMQSTLAFIQQNNSGSTDRRFAYLQHSNSLIPKVTFFGSLEVDLYQKFLNPEDSSYSGKSKPKFSNAYVSVNYRIIKQLSLAFSYSARQNVVYYETDKDYLDRLLDYQTLQGYLLTLTALPVKRLSIGVTGGYRFRKDDPRPTKNVYSYISYSRIPGIGISATGSFTWMETAYINGKVYSLGISREFVSGRLSAGLTYRYVDYRYTGDQPSSAQNVGEASFRWRIWKRFSFSLFYEGTFDSQYTYNRLYGQLNMGF